MNLIQEIGLYFEKGQHLEANKELLLEDLLKRAESELKRLNTLVNKQELRELEARGASARDRMDFLNEPV